MQGKRKIIMITDGDHYAQKTIEMIARQMGGRCISASSGNPSQADGPELVRLIKKAASDPVLVMFDDSGLLGEGAGEQNMKYVAEHPDIEVLGIIAVAAKTKLAEWTKVDVSIDREGNLTEYGVDKYGLPDLEVGRINGDTVYCIDSLHVPIVVGIGDIGKMAKKDELERGSPITRAAVELILERSRFSANK